jgi:hypothetical protein
MDRDQRKVNSEDATQHSAADLAPRNRSYHFPHPALGRSRGVGKSKSMHRSGAIAASTICIYIETYFIELRVQ